MFEPKVTNNMKKIIALLLLYVGLNPIWAQQKMLTLEDAILKQRTTLSPERLSQLQWVPNTNKLFYVGKKNGKDVGILVNTSNMSRDTMLTLENFNSAFRNLEKNEKDMGRFPFFTFTDNNTIRFFYNNAYYNLMLSNLTVKLIAKAPKEAEDLLFEPNTNRLAYTISNNVYVALDKDEKINHSAIDGESNEKGNIITRDGTYGLVNGKAVHRNEFGINQGMFFSSKGNKLAYYKLFEGMVTNYSLMDIESLPADASKTVSTTNVNQMKYPMAGNTSHEAKVFVYNFKNKRQVEVNTGNTKDLYLTNIAFSPDEEYLYIAVVNRAQNKMDLNQYDAATGAFIRTLFTEENKRYVEPEKPVLFNPKNPREFFWFSERDGYNHIYLYNAKGELLKQITKGKMVVTEIIGFDEKAEHIFYMATSEDGLSKFAYKTNLKTLATLQITKIPGQHTVILDNKGEWLVDQLTNLTTPRRYTLFNTKGAEFGTIFNAFNPLAEYKPVTYKLFSIPSSDKSVNLNCRMVLPANFDSTRKYPVVVYVYGGPHAQMVTNSWLGGGDMWFYFMAQQGYIVFTLDNRGSMNRGFDFESIIHRNLGKYEMEDQIAGVNYLKQQKYVDAGRLGVFGWSFGGFMSVSLMTKTPDIFKVGVAGGPVIDWRMYEIMYTERYMDMPQENAEGYNNANTLNYIKNLKGKLLLIHGTNDNVVLWQHTLTYLKKSVEDGVLVDYFVYPGHEHNVLGPDRAHLYKKVTQYFKDYL